MNRTFDMARRLIASVGLLTFASWSLAQETTVDLEWPGAARGIAPITVGPDPGCDEATVAAGVIAAPAGGTVRIMSGTYNENQSIGIYKSLQVIGGYPDCNPASTPNGRSTITRGGSGLVVDIFYNAGVGDPVRLVELENLVITGGDGAGFSSGGVVVEGRPGRLAVNIRNTEISGNDRTGADDDGAGLRIITTGDRDGSGTFVTLDNDSFVFNNTTTAGDGGGIHCRSIHDQGTATMLRLGTTLVFDNEAVNGGGVALDGCQNVFLYSGGPIVLILPSGGIVGNTASGNGGGLHLENGAEATLSAREFGGFGDSTEAAVLAANTATGSGGGAYVIDAGSSLQTIDAYVVANTASGFGGGIGVNLGGEADIGRLGSTSACEPPISGGGVLRRPPCSVFEDNDAFGGGAFFARGPSRLWVSNTVVRENTTAGGLGPAARISNSSLYEGQITEFRMEGSVVHDNSGGFLFVVEQNANAEVLYSTIADNPVALARLSTAAGQFAGLDLKTSVVDASSWFSKSGSGANQAQVRCAMGDLPSGNLGADTIEYYTPVLPAFRDRDARDYRPSDRSAAIDYCDGSDPALFDDPDGNPRGVAWTGPTPGPASGGVPGGVYDVGAYERVFEPRTADLQIDIANPDLFVDASQTSVEFVLAVTNNGPEVAYADVDVIDDVTGGAITNRQWTCAAPPGVSCTPASGSGQVQAAISDLPPGDIVIVTVNADLIDNSNDGFFNYAAAVFESGFNTDPNTTNNGDGIEVRFGIFADSFESPAPF